MTAPEATSTRPYLLRALMEWCTDNGFTPHIAVRVDRNTQVPMEFVRDGQIVLNISYDATSGLLIGNDYVQFTARFGGKPREIMVPVVNVMAIYARETGQGMAFPPEDEELDEAAEVESEELEAALDEEHAAEDRVVQLVTAKAEDDDPDDDQPRTPPPAGGRPALKRVK
ncbi:ClpXP protease specificity-enhancing factor [Comamonas resistens]|uniref:ClpXP protease specificity-enhancing factor n=1 Tax=Comamonas resistens TaxID=3046670 RepID=A0ABY8STE0_9BURK|nr:ClpXP protease specificity-enhancing factor [Comamonas resistens]MDL5036215.1 ClpXP protease specificity-enhancing factor [Comamonas resistens]WHS66307.1 ClpXP protease specificity-enhancing factor [Comamonas resistens]